MALLGLGPGRGDDGNAVDLKRDLAKGTKFDGMMISRIRVTGVEAKDLMYFANLDERT